MFKLSDHQILNITIKLNVLLQMPIFMSTKIMTKFSYWVWYTGQITENRLFTGKVLPQV